MINEIECRTPIMISVFVINIVSQCEIKMDKITLAIFLIQISTIQANLNVSIYYEALCPDSKEFINEQFYPTFKKMGNYLNIDLVPYGKGTDSNSTGHWVFSCQHGPTECYSNKVQACALALNWIDSSVDFVNCVMMTADPADHKNLKKCANINKVSWEDIQHCIQSGQGDKLLAFNGEKTHAVKPAITFIPAITFNGVFNESTQNKAVENFQRITCLFLHKMGLYNCPELDTQVVLQII